jgi:hypothetical protein
MLRALEFILFFYLIYRLIKNLFAPAGTVGGGAGPQQNFNNPPHNRKEGNVSITDVPQNGRKHPAHKDNDGEYIDYKEL